MRTPNLVLPSRASRLAAVLVGWVVGCVLQLQQAALWSEPLYLSLSALGLLGLAALTWRWRTLPLAAGRLGRVALALCAMAMALGYVGWRACGLDAQALAPSLEGQDLTVQGMVSAMPQRLESGWRFMLEVDSASLQGQPVHIPPKLLLGWYSGQGFGFEPGRMQADLLAPLPELSAGQRWQFSLRLKAAHGSSNPHGFDYELWLWEQGVRATGYVRSGRSDTPPLLLAQTWRHPVELARQAVHEAIYQRVADGPRAGLLSALVVGDQNAIHEADWDVFRATGVAHLMSISGFHITMFSWLTVGWVGWLWRRSSRLCLFWPAPEAALVIGVALAAAYAVLSGWGLPAQRTTCMLVTVGLLRLSGLSWPWPMVWLWAMAVMVGVDPWALLQPGFWLSFCAVGLLFATQPVHGQTPVPGWKGHALAALRQQRVVVLALTPLTLLLFNQVSLVGFVANALAIPWVTLGLTPLAMLGIACPPLWDVAAWAVGGMMVVLRWLADLPFASVSVATPPFWLAVAAMLGGTLLAMPWPKVLRLLGVPLLLPVLFWQVPRPAVGQFELLAADIGQGNAVLVRTASHSLLYDSGPRFSGESDAGQRVLVPLLRALGERLDRVLLSHRDADHTGGAKSVLTMQPQADLLSSIESNHSLQQVRRAQRCVAGQHWDWDGVRFDILHPQISDYDTATKTNALSCVLRIDTGSRSALLVADIERPQEWRLLAEHSPVQADVLLVPHHGSKTSSSLEFLDAVAPRLAWVQAGYRNRFGHPAASVMRRYQERHIRVLDTPHCGAIQWSSESPDVVHCQREQDRHYWQPPALSPFIDPSGESEN